MMSRGSTDNPVWHEMFVNDDGNPTMAWLMSENRTALEAAQLVNDCLGLDGDDGFAVSKVYGVIEPWSEGTSEWRFRKPTEDERRASAATVPMWEVKVQ